RVLRDLAMLLSDFLHQLGDIHHLLVRNGTRYPPFDPGSIDLHRPSPPTLVCPLRCDQGPAWSIEAELKREIASIAGEKFMRFDTLGAPHAEQAPGAARHTTTHSRAVRTAPGRASGDYKQSAGESRPALASGSSRKRACQG